MNKQLDDGDGLSRMSLLRYQHEQDTGITSSTTKVSLGFNKNVILLFLFVQCTDRFGPGLGKLFLF